MQQACGQPDEYRAANGEICDRDIRIVMMARERVTEGCRSMKIYMERSSSFSKKKNNWRR
jgi:hypothetical protein